MKWGRKKGKCTHMISKETTLNKRKKSGGSGAKPKKKRSGGSRLLQGEAPKSLMLWERQQKSLKDAPPAPPPPRDSSQFALKDAPGLRGMDNPASFRKAFQDLGFGPSEHAALMGAHTFGKITALACYGQFKGVQNGPWCNEREKLDPPVSAEQMVENGCIPEIGKVKKCWGAGEWQKTVLNPAFVYKNDGEIRPKAQWWGGGAFWDRTPTTFDNDYFKIFHQEDFNDKDSCCGTANGRGPNTGCRNGGTMQHRKTKAAIGGACDHNWCRSDEGGKQVMKSTKAWAESDHNFIRRAGAWNPARKMIRLPGDWALIHDNETRAAVGLFANDEAKFFEVFGQAFTKVLGKGQVSLKTCGEM